MHEREANRSTQLEAQSGMLYERTIYARNVERRTDESLL